MQGYSVVVFILCACANVHGYPGYADTIPNGRAVPDPCNPGQTWGGVGHMSPEGRDARNQFGLDYRTAGGSWSVLCSMDSDGDGRTNGQELGDPGCIWTPGSTASQTTGLSHPGYCDAASCQPGNLITCESTSLNCPALSEPGVETRTISFPRTKVPATKTNYYCMTFDLDQSADYHLIGSTSNVDNAVVAHHMIVSGCVDGARSVSTPEPCGMTQCNDNIALWTIGYEGECMYKEAGFRLGRTGYKKVQLEIHWNNFEERDDQFDGSGMTLYFTRNLRPNDAGVFWVGQNYLEVKPEEQKSQVFTSTCPGHCTERILGDTIYITRAINHMHLLGVGQVITRVRNSEVAYLTNEMDYDYNTPKVVSHNPPMEIRKGDEINTACHFKSKGRTTTTFMGLGTTDEMCYGIFVYYPKQAAVQPSCQSWKDMNFCETVNGVNNGCPTGKLFNNSDPDTIALMDEVLASCGYTGGCRKECPAAVKKAKENPCLKGAVGEFNIYQLSRRNEMKFLRFTTALRSCDSEGDGTTWTWPTAGAPKIAGFSALLVLCIAVLII